MLLSKQVAANIKNARIAQGLSRPDLASRFAPPTAGQQIKKLETGSRGLTLDWVERSAEALGMDPKQLIVGEPIRPVMTEAVAVVFGKALIRLVGCHRPPHVDALPDVAAVLQQIDEIFRSHPETAVSAELALPAISLVVQQQLG